MRFNKETKNTSYCFKEKDNGSQKKEEVMATKAERMHMDRVAQLGCYVCKAPATLHHIRNNGSGNVGMGRRSSHFEVIPLCYEHHQGNTGIHLDKKNFIKKYGTEKEILDNVLLMVETEICRSSIV